MQDVAVGGFTVIRAGALAEGSVVRVEGKRSLGLGGDVIIKLDSVELAAGERIGLIARKEFKGKSHAIRIGMEMAIVGAIYWPAAPVFLLSRGRDSTVLKGTEVTAYTKSDASIEAGDLPILPETAPELSEIIKLLPPRALNGEGREGDMLNLIFAAKEWGVCARRLVKSGKIQTSNHLAFVAAGTALHEITDGQAFRFWKSPGLFILAA